MPDPEAFQDAEVPDPEALQHALERAYRYLNVRERTVGEVRRHLARDELDAGVVEEAIALLRDQGYLDDERFARLFAQDKRELEEWGTERIARGLRTRGIEPDLIEATVGGESHAGELDRALALLRRRFPAPPRDRRERDRALGVLIRKGYDGELALDALRAYASSRVL